LGVRCCKKPETSEGNIRCEAIAPEDIRSMQGGTVDLQWCQCQQSVGGNDMKIMETGGQQAVQGTTEVRNKKADKAGMDFSALLDGELTAGSDAATVTTESAGAVDSIALSQSIGTSVADGAGYASVADAIEAQLGKLEDIGTSLQDESVSLKNVDAMLTGLSAEAKSLDSSLEGLPDEHPLRQIGDELNVLTYVESVKWRRGDYL